MRRAQVICRDENGLPGFSGTQKAQHQNDTQGLLYHNDHNIVCIVFTRSPDGPEVYLLRRDGSEIPIYQEYVYHSPTGFEWGYGGSGPADLALNLLAKLIGLENAKRLYQQFKWDMIASIPREGGSIPIEAVIAWLRGGGVDV